MTVTVAKPPGLMPMVQESLKKTDTFSAQNYRSTQEVQNEQAALAFQLLTQKQMTEMRILHKLQSMQPDLGTGTTEPAWNSLSQLTQQDLNRLGVIGPLTAEKPSFPTSSHVKKKTGCRTNLLVLSFHER